MAEFDDLLHNYATHAAQALPPITSALAERLGVTDQADIEVLGRGLAEAYMQGVDAGQSEMVAQATEQGVAVNVSQLRSDD